MPVISSLAVFAPIFEGVFMVILLRVSISNRARNRRSLEILALERTLTLLYPRSDARKYTIVAMALAMYVSAKLTEDTYNSVGRIGAYAVYQTY